MVSCSMIPHNFTCFHFNRIGRCFSQDRDGSQAVFSRLVGDYVGKVGIILEEIEKL